eukprot:scaffold1589_cov111-Isochrysis_galbana.AAC.7
MLVGSPCDLWPRMRAPLQQRGATACAARAVHCTAVLATATCHLLLYVRCYPEPARRQVVSCALTAKAQSRGGAPRPRQAVGNQQQLSNAKLPRCVGGGSGGYVCGARGRVWTGALWPVMPSLPVVCALAFLSCCARPLLLTILYKAAFPNFGRKPSKI